MKIKLHATDGKAHVATLPFEGSDSVEVDMPCPHCKRDAPIRVYGGSITRGHDTYTAKAKTRCCGYSIGKLVVTVDTIFGIEEDERVLNGRCRVY